MGKTGKPSQKNIPGKKNTVIKTNNSAAKKKQSNHKVTWNVDKMFIASTIVCAIPFMLSVIYFGQLPEQIVTHWNLQGIANGYSSKMFVTVGLPLIFLAAHVIVYYAVERDPKRENQPKALRNIIFWIVPALAVMVQSLTIAGALGKSVNFSFYLMLLIGAILLVMGVFLPKCKLNYTIGFKLPWTLSSEENWNKTHHFAGYIWVACGIILIANAFLLVNWLLITAIVVACVVPAVYSFMLYRNR